MRLLVLSDLHLEFQGFTPPESSLYDVVVLAGDISIGTKSVRWASRRSTFGGAEVIFVAGNHEFFNANRRDMLRQLREAAEGSSVHVLDRDAIVVQGVRFLGATLWTDFQLLEASGLSTFEAMAHARQAMNDFKLIRDSEAGNRRQLFSPTKAREEHLLSRAWLSRRLTESTALPTVVVTHHAPSARSMHPQYAGSPLNPAFYSELPAEFFSTADLWIHGHSHSSADYLHGSTRVVSNPRGYFLRGREENPGFKRDLVIEIR